MNVRERRINLRCPAEGAHCEIKFCIVGRRVSSLGEPGLLNACSRQIVVRCSEFGLEAYGDFQLSERTVYLAYGP